MIFKAKKTPKPAGTYTTTLRCKCVVTTAHDPGWKPLTCPNGHGRQDMISTMICHQTP